MTTDLTAPLPPAPTDGSAVVDGAAGSPAEEPERHLKRWRFVVVSISLACC